MEIIYAIGTALSALSALLAWAAKIYWSKEHQAATGEIIKSKDSMIELLKAEINSYKELTPMKIREYFLSMRSQLEEYNGLLQNQLSEAKNAISAKEKEMKELLSKGEEKSKRLEELEKEKNDLQNKTEVLSVELEEFTDDSKFSNNNLFIPLKINKNNINKIKIASEDLSNIIPSSKFKNIKTLSNSLSNYLYLDNDFNLPLDLSNLNIDNNKTIDE